MKTKLKNTKKTSNQAHDHEDPLDGDLSGFIAEGGWQVVKFELKEKKDKVLSLRLSEKLLKEIRKQAEKSGLGVQKYLRILIESNIKKKAG